MTSKKRTVSIQGEGIAVFKLIGYFENKNNADKFMKKQFDKDEKLGNRYRIYKAEKTMLWGTEYDKV